MRGARDVQAKQENGGREKPGGKTKRVSERESGSSRKTWLRLFRRVRRERKTSDVSVRARSEGREQEGVVVVGQGVGNDHTTLEESTEERRREGHGDVGRQWERVGPTKR